MAFTKVTGTLVDIGDLDLTNVGQIQLDSIAGDADANTSITFSGSDVITIATGGETQVTFNNGSILPTTDNDVDLGSSSLEFKDGYFDGTLYADAIDLNGTNLTAFDTDAAQVFNESGAAVDFRIEGDTEENLFFVDGSADKIGIGTAVNIDRTLTISTGLAKTSTTTAYPFAIQSNESSANGRLSVHYTGGSDAASRKVFFQMEEEGVANAGQIHLNPHGGTVHAPNGLIFGTETTAAHTLDDYEEGTFTPTFSGATLSTATGSYTKIGNQVTAHFHVVTTGGLPSSGGQVQVGALPFTSGSNFMGAGSIYVGPSNVSSATGGGGQISIIMEGSATVVRFVNVDTGTLGYTLWGELEISSNNVVTAIGSITYTV